MSLCALVPSVTSPTPITGIYTDIPLLLGWEGAVVRKDGPTLLIITLGRQLGWVLVEQHNSRPQLLPDAAWVWTCTIVHVLLVLFGMVLTEAC